MLKKKEHHYSAWAEIDLKAIRHNYREIKKLVRKSRNPSQILAVVKADAYGHGMLEVVLALNHCGVDFWGVSDVTEGIRLSKSGTKKAILLFESTLPSCAQRIIDYKLTPTVCTLSMASALNACARAANRKVDIHVKIDTGMGRLGVSYEEAHDFINHITRFPYLSIKGIYTHFPVAESNPGFTRKQIKQLCDVVKDSDKQAVIVSCVHAANSMGLVGYKRNILNLVRPGLMLYGLYPTPNFRGKIKLKPAMSVKARVIFLKRILKGTGVSYGHTFISRRDMMVATLAVGYSDGYLRCLSNKAFVLIDGRRCPVVGRVTMDQIMVDVSRVKSVKLGMEAVVLGTQKKQRVSAEELAARAGTIHYEIVCSLGSRLPRVYKT